MFNIKVYWYISYASDIGREEDFPKQLQIIPFWFMIQEAKAVHFVLFDNSKINNQVFDFAFPDVNQQ